MYQRRVCIGDVRLNPFPNNPRSSESGVFPTCPQTGRILKASQADQAPVKQTSYFRFNPQRGVRCHLGPPPRPPRAARLRLVAK